MVEQYPVGAFAARNRGLEPIPSTTQTRPRGFVLKQYSLRVAVRPQTVAVPFFVTTVSSGH